MTATAERVLQEIKTLPPADLRAVWEQVTRLMGSAEGAAAEGPTRPASEEALRALDALDGKFAGAGLIDRLLEERQRDRLNGDRLPA